MCSDAADRAEHPVRRLRPARRRRGRGRGGRRLAARRRDGRPLRAEPHPRACPSSKSLHAATALPLDCHLMIDDPDRWAAGYAEAGARQRDLPRRGGDRRRPDCTSDPGGRARAPASRCKPATALDAYADVLAEFDMVLVMTVEPGFGGQRSCDDAAEGPPRRGASCATAAPRLDAGRRRGRRGHHRRSAPRPAPTCSSPGRRSSARTIRALRCGGCAISPAAVRLPRRRRRHRVSTARRRRHHPGRRRRRRHRPVHRDRTCASRAPTCSSRPTGPRRWR